MRAPAVEPFFVPVRKRASAARFNASAGVVAAPTFRRRAVDRTPRESSADSAKGGSGKPPTDHAMPDNSTRNAAGDETSGAARITADLMPVISATVLMVAVMARLRGNRERRCSRRRQRDRANDPGELLHGASLSRFCFANLTRNIAQCFPLMLGNDEPCAHRDAS